MRSSHGRSYSRDGRRGKLQVNYGLLTDARRCPVAVSVYEGNTADPETLRPEIDRLRNDFAVRRLVMVGDAHSFNTLLAELGTIVRNTCRMPQAEPDSAFRITTAANPTQQRAFELIRQMAV